MQGLIDRATKADIIYNEEQYKQSESFMKRMVKALLARDLYDNSSYFRIVNEENEAFNEALKLINLSLIHI